MFGFGMPEIILLLIYFIPLFVAIRRKHTKLKHIILLNILLGWTVLGWVGALVWSFVDPERRLMV